MLKIDHLRYFVAAAETGSFLAAASRVRISPSSISYAVDCLEDSLGTALFVRKAAAGVVLTNDGNRLLRRAKSLIHEMEDLETRFGRHSGGLVGDLVVGCQEGLTWTLAPHAFSIVKRDNPDLNISLKTIWLDTRFASLDNGEVDVLLTFLIGEKPPKHYASTLLCRPQVYALMRKGHPLDNGKPVALQDLANYPQVQMQDGPAFDYYYNMYRSIGAEPVVQTASNVSMCAQALIGRSDAVSLRIMRPSHTISPLGDEIVYPLLTDQVTLSSLYAITVSDKKLEAGDKRYEFIQVCKEQFDNGEMKANFYY
ncbi:LysR family transcriptional regulator [Altererythrobacter sp.]|uniref:LysR substrate-binding domain-containing protein n=1 Tax=Altererythrobacter sp. TaxID=1872480 RepID=UPI003CFDD080